MSNTPSFNAGQYRKEKSDGRLFALKPQYLLYNPTLVVTVC